MTTTVGLEDDPVSVGPETLRAVSRFASSILGYAPLILGAVGSGLYYMAYVAERDYLASFGLISSMFGGGRPDLAAIAVPFGIISVVAIASFFRGLTDDKDPPAWIQRLIERSLSNDPRKALIRTSFWTVLISASLTFLVMHMLAHGYGSVKADLVRYKVSNRGCESGCISVRVKSPSTRLLGKASAEYVGVPVHAGNGVIALYTGDGVTILKTDEVASIARISLLNRRQGTTGRVFDLLIASPFRGY